MCTVNIIMAVYNGERYLREQIDSILNNTHKDIILTICDDGSKDTSLDIAEEYVKEYPNRVVVHRNESNLGVILNFLEGVRRSTADYIMFCDQDDIWLPNKIERTLAAMKKAEKSGNKRIPAAVFTDAKVVDSGLKVINPSFYRAGGMNPKKRTLAGLMMENKLQGCTTMINSEVRRLLNPIPRHARMHDWWIALICQSFGRIVFVDEPTLLYRQHGNNVVGNQSFFSYFLNRIGSISKQKEALKAVQKQAAEFYFIYKEILEGDDKRLVYQLAELGKQGWLKRRIIILKNGYLKSGLIRNIGILLLV